MKTSLFSVACVLHIATCAASADTVWVRGIAYEDIRITAATDRTVTFEIDDRTVTKPHADVTRIDRTGLDAFNEAERLLARREFEAAAQRYREALESSPSGADRVLIRARLTLAEKPPAAATRPRETREKRCPWCFNTGRMRCTYCNATGKERCPHCTNGYVACGRCNGAGEIECTACGGDGRDYHGDCSRCDGDGAMPCPDCENSPHKGMRRCSRCQGAGRLGPCHYCGGAKTIRCRHCDRGTDQPKDPGELATAAGPRPRQGADERPHGLHSGSHRTYPQPVPVRSTAERSKRAEEYRARIADSPVATPRTMAAWLLGEDIEPPDALPHWQSMAPEEKQRFNKLYRDALKRRRETDLDGKYLSWDLWLKDVSPVPGRDTYRVEALSRDGFLVTAEATRTELRNLGKLERELPIRIGGIIADHEIEAPARSDAKLLFDGHQTPRMGVLVKRANLFRRNEAHMIRLFGRSYRAEQVYFLIDGSPSMADAGALDVAKGEVAEALKELRIGQGLAVAPFSSPSGSEYYRLHLRDQEELDAAIRAGVSAVNRIRPTEAQSPASRFERVTMCLRYESGHHTVFLITDGKTEGFDDIRKMLEEMDPDDTYSLRLYCVLIGERAGAAVADMRELAENYGGELIHVRPKKDAD